MGDQELLHRFDLPPASFEISGYLTSLFSPAEVVCGLLRPHYPMRDYPHFPFSAHIEEEENARCVAFREFVWIRICKLLEEHCITLVRDGAYPVCVIMSAVVDTVAHLTQKNLSEILNKSITLVDPEGLSWDSRYERLVSLIDEAKRNPEEQRKRMGTTVLEYPDQDDLRIVAEKLIDLNELPFEKLNVNGLCQIEFQRWIEFQQQIIKDRVAPTGWWQHPCFSVGKFLKDRLPAQLRAAIDSKIKKRKDKRLNKYDEFHTKVVNDFLEKQPIGKEEYLRVHYPRLLRLCFRNSSVKSPKESTVRRWLEQGQIKKWQKTQPPESTE